MQAIDLWIATFDDLALRFVEFDKLLSDDERQRAERFIAEDVRLKFILARGLLRTILGRELMEKPTDLEFTYGERGKPSINGSMTKFNLSHSNNLVALGIVENYDIGVDVEFMRQMKEMPIVVQDNFSQSEQDIWFSLPEPEKLEAFYTCWTRKEAYIKSTGDGFHLPLRAFDVTFLSGEEPRIRRAERDDPKRWTLLHVDPAPDYVGAICVEGQGEFEVRRQVFK